MKLKIIISLIMVTLINLMYVHSSGPSNPQEKCTLRSTHIVLRHGFRAPFGVIPKDPSISDLKKWPLGLGQLTQKGIDQCVRVGKYIRDRYRDFYPKDSRNAVVQTSHLDRRIDCGALITNQLWPATLDEKWIAPRIFHVPNLLDTMLAHNPYCPNFATEFGAILNGPVVQNYLKKNKKLIDLIVEKTGISVGFYNLFVVADAILVLRYHGYPLPKWAEPYYDDFVDMVAKLHDWVHLTPRAQRLFNGRYFRELVLRMDEVLSSNITADRWYRNFFLYPAHSFIVGGILMSLNIPHSVQPPFGSMFIFELHTINKNKNVVRSFYIDKTESFTQPITGSQIKLPGCPSLDCPYDTFLNYVANLSSISIKSECGITDDFNFYDVLQDTAAYPHHGIINIPTNPPT